MEEPEQCFQEAQETPSSPAYNGEVESTEDAPVVDAEDAPVQAAGLEQDGSEVCTAVFGRPLDGMPAVHLCSTVSCPLSVIWTRC